jgi:hypothetical protein
VCSISLKHIRIRKFSSAFNIARDGSSFAGTDEPINQGSKEKSNKISTKKKKVFLLFSFFLKSKRVSERVDNPILVLFFLSRFQEECIMTEEVKTFG